MKTKSDRLQRDIVLLALSMFVIVAAWIGFNVYHSRVDSTVDEVLQTQINPIPGNFDNATIQKLKSRTVIQPDFVHPVSSTDAQPESVEIQPTETPIQTFDESLTTADAFPIPTDTIIEITPEGGTQ